MNWRNRIKSNRTLEKQIQSLNLHLPKGRASLAELLKMTKPRIDTRDGKTHRFKKKELRYLSKLLSEDLHEKLRLPILIRISPQFGRGAAKVSGKPECIVIKRILEKDTEEEREMLIYRPEIRTVRRKLPTTTQYAFQISSTPTSSWARGNLP